MAVRHLFSFTTGTGPAVKILLLTRYTSAGASSRYRSYCFLPYLRSLGHDVTVSPFMSDRYLERLYSGKSVDRLDLAASMKRRFDALRTSGTFDLLWIEGEAFPWLPSAVEDLFLNGRTPYVVDYDDAIFHRYDQHRSALVRGILSRKIDRVMRNAAAVIAGNEYIAARAERAGAKKIEILPTVVDLSQYPASPPSREGDFTIGWVGSMSTAKYLAEVEGPLRTMNEKGRVRLIAVGAQPPSMDGIRFETGPWSEEQEMAEMKKFTVGIMPLVDSPWERGKCGHKLVKYMGCFLPVIASPVGVNREIVEHGVNGFLASSDGEWITALQTLRDDPALRAKMGEAGRKKVERDYSLTAVAPRLARVLGSAVHGAA